jgi:UDP-glucose 4-epimerase
LITEPNIGFDVMNKIGLVGANGFIGSAIRSSPLFSDSEIYSFGRTNRVTGDLDSINLMSNFNQVIWTASLTNPSIAESRDDLVQLEYQNWVNFLEKLSSMPSPIPRIIFISSGGCVYSGSKTRFKEADLAEGTNEYGRLKLRMEKALSESDLSYTIIRAANIYGPDQPTGRGQGVIAEWVNAAKTGKPIQVFGSAQVQRDFLYLSDFLDSIRKILRSNHNRIVNIGSGKCESLSSIIEALKIYSPIPIEVTFSPARGFDRLSYGLDIDLAEREYGWHPRISLQEGVAKCFSTTLE